MVASILVEDIVNDFKELKPIFRDVLIAWYVDKLTYKEVAEKLEIPLNTVRSRLHRAKRKLNFDPDYLER